jgi:quercetin dioxygenase-like cupin family protein
MNTVSLADLAPEGREPVFEAPYTVAVGLDAGETIPKHRHAGQDITLVVHDGELELTVGQETATLGAGEAAAFDGDDGVSVTATADTQALVVFSDRD